MMYSLRPFLIFALFYNFFNLKSFKHKLVKSFSWNSLGIIITQVWHYLVYIILIRILKPEDFGLLAMIIALTGFANIIRDAGFSAALIQKESINEDHMSSCFWLNLVIGCCFTLFFYYTSAFFSNFYSQPDLELLFKVISFDFIITSIYLVHNALLQKELNFKKISIILITCSFISGIIAIILAFLGFGVWALVGRTLIMSLCSMILYVFWSTWIPRFRFQLQAIKEIFSYGINFTGVQILRYWSQKIDDILIGRYESSTLLGYYSTAYSFLLLPQSILKRQVYHVFFPAFSIIQSNINKQRVLYLKLTEVTVFFYFPLMLGLFSISEELVFIFFGTKWSPIIPYLKIFCLASLFNGIGFPGIIFMANGYASQLFKLTLITRLILVIFIVLGLFLKGALGVAIGVFFGITIHTIIYNIYGIKLINIQIKEILKIVFPYFLISLGMVFFISLVNFSSLFFTLIVKIILGSFFYLFVSWKSKLKAIIYCKDIFLSLNLPFNK